jgi:hypothetical protein
MGSYFCVSPKEITNMITRKRLSLAAIACALIVSLSGSAVAQDGQPFQPPADSAPAPVNPSQKSIAGGKVLITIGSIRPFGYHIGDRIPVTIVVSTEPGTLVSTEQLRRKVLSPTGSDFEMVGPPVIRETTANGRKLTIIELVVRSWVLDPEGKKQWLALTADLHHATGFAADGKTPNWKLVTTPELIVTTSNTATAGSKDMLDGDLDSKVTPLPPAVWPMRILGAPLLLSLPLWLVWRQVKRIVVGLLIPPNERAWKVFNLVLSERHRTGTITGTGYQSVTNALRAFLKVESLTLAQTRPALEEHFAKHSQKEAMVAAAYSALYKLDAVLYTSGHTLGEAEQTELFTQIALVVPTSE